MCKHYKNGKFYPIVHRWTRGAKLSKISYDKVSTAFYHVRIWKMMISDEVRNRREVTRKWGTEWDQGYRGSWGGATCNVVLDPKGT